MIDTDTGDLVQATLFTFKNFFFKKDCFCVFAVKNEFPNIVYQILFIFRNTLKTNFTFPPPPPPKKKISSTASYYHNSSQNKRELLFVPWHHFLENLSLQQKQGGSYKKNYFVPCARFSLQRRLIEC